MHRLPITSKRESGKGAAVDGLWTVTDRFAANRRL